MTQSTAENFLRKNRTTIVNCVTKEQCDSLVDFLLQKNILIDESGSEIHTLNTSQKKMRKLLESVKTKKGYELVLEWLEDNVRDLIDDLENNSDSDHDPPPKKKSRRHKNDVDEADSCFSQPDLKDLSFPQLEEWVSNSTVSQNLIKKLKKKLADGEMEALKKQLKNKKVKTHFFFFPKDVRKIESNRKLKSFLDASKDAKFPDLSIELFFAKKDSLQDKSLPETTNTDLNSSGYESLHYSQNSSQSIVSKDPLLESKDQSFDSAASNTQHQNESTAKIQQENKDGSPLEKEMEAQANVCEPHASPQNSNAFKVAEDLQVLPFHEPDHEDGTPEQQQESITHMQCEPETDRNEPVFDSNQVMDDVSQEEHEGSNFYNQKLPSTHYQKVSPVQMHHEHKEYIPLEKVMEERGAVSEKMCEPLIDKSHVAGTIPATTQSVVTEDRIQGVAPGASEEKSESYSITLPETTVMSLQKQNVPKQAEVALCHLDQKLDMRKSKSITHVQCDSETDRNEPIVEPDHAGISEDRKQGMDEVSQKEPKLPADHFENGSPVQIQNDNKDGIPLEGAMEAQVNICEPHTLPQKSNVSKEAEDLQALPCCEPDHKDDKPLEQPLNMLKSVTHMQCNQEITENQPIFYSDQVMDEVFQEERGGSKFSNQELPPYHYQNASPAQIQHDDKDGTSLEEGLCSMPVSDSGKTTGKAKRQPRNTSKLRSEHRRLLYDWALKKCSSEEEIKKVFDCISFQNQVEHREYPCFVAENIMIYTDPKNGDKQIIITDDKNKDFKKNLPKEITFIPEYQMWVCGIEKAVVIRNQEEREIRIKPFDAILQLCKELVFEALAPALAVFKHIQRQEKLYSLTKDH